MRQKLLFLALIIGSSCYVAEDVAPDQQIWDYSFPDDQGISSQTLLGLNERIQFNQFSEINGLIIIKNDQLIFENYFNRKVDDLGTITRPPTLKNRELASNIGNASLIFALSAIAIADDKRILSLEDPIHTYLPAYSDVFNDDPNKEDITIAHLLAHRSGFSWNGSFQPFSIENDINQMKLANDWIRFILEKPLEAPAGLRYNFNAGAGLILSKIIENASGQDYVTFLRENLLDPLTISSFEIGVDPQGNFNSADGIAVTLLDLTKLGYLYIQDGTWQGRKIIDPNFIAEATSVQSEVSGTLTAGYIWNFFGIDFLASFGVPHNEIFYISGGIGQSIYIIPSENMIVSIFAENYFFGFVNPSLNLFAEITHTFI
ncbi:MAG: serine hydrolase [Ekhidna sp.]